MADRLELQLKGLLDKEQKEKEVLQNSIEQEKALEPLRGQLEFDRAEAAKKEDRLKDFQAKEQAEKEICRQETEIQATAAQKEKLETEKTNFGRSSGSFTSAGKSASCCAATFVSVGAGEKSFAGTEGFVAGNE